MTPAGALALAALLAAGIIGGGTLAATARMERDHARQVACAQRLSAELAKRPLLAKGFMRTGDACRDLLLAVSGESR